MNSPLPRIDRYLCGVNDRIDEYFLRTSVPPALKARPRDQIIMIASILVVLAFFALPKIFIPNAEKLRVMVYIGIFQTAFVVAILAPVGGYLFRLFRVAWSSDVNLRYIEIKHDVVVALLLFCLAGFLAQNGLWKISCSVAFVALVQAAVSLWRGLRFSASTLEARRYFYVFDIVLFLTLISVVIPVAKAQWG